MDQKPSVGRIVHYTRYDGNLCLAAMVTSVNEDATLQLSIFKPDGDRVFPGDDVPLGTGEHGTWHWPERV